MQSFNKIFLLIILSLIISCEADKENNIVERLQGDWILRIDDKDMNFLSFKDSSVTGFYYDHFFSPFYISKDTIIIPEIGIWRNIKIPFLRVTDKYLWTKGKTDKDLYPFISTNNYFNGRIALKEIEIKFQNDFYRSLINWSLYLNENFDCYLQITYKGNERKEHFPLSYSKGDYYSALSKQEFEFIQRKVRNLPLDKLKRTYKSVEHNSFQGIGPNIELLINYGFTDNKEIKKIEISSIGFDGLPMILGVLINYLHQIHTFVEFKPTDEQYKLKY